MSAPTVTGFYVKVRYPAPARMPYADPMPSDEARDALVSLGLCTAGEDGTTTVTVAVDNGCDAYVRRRALRLAGEHARAMGIDGVGEVLSTTPR